jgi:hypothetical protein
MKREILSDLMVGQLSDEDVYVTRAPDGRPMIVPASLRKLPPEQLSALANIQDQVLVIQQAQAVVEDLVHEARQDGVSWVAIAWYLGVTAEAARQRFGVEK